MQTPRTGAPRRYQHQLVRTPSASAPQAQKQPWAVPVAAVVGIFIVTLVAGIVWGNASYARGRAAGTREGAVNAARAAAALEEAKRPKPPSAPDPSTLDAKLASPELVSALAAQNEQQPERAVLAAPGAVVPVLSDAEADAVVNGRHGSAVVLFHQPNCMPCKAYAPTFEEAAKASALPFFSVEMLTAVRTVALAEVASTPWVLGVAAAPGGGVRWEYLDRKLRGAEALAELVARVTRTA